MKATNECPICGNEVEKDCQQYYCERCGFNIQHKKETKPKQTEYYDSR